MKNILFYLFIFSSLSAQNSAYNFSKIIDIEAESVKNQQKTGTCWSFATSSFLESEIYREKKIHVDLSEMYNVRMTYPMKAWNYIYRQKTAQFGEGGLSHDVINSMTNFGLVPQSAYSGLIFGEKLDHSKLTPMLKNYLDHLAENPKTALKKDWMETFSAKLDSAMGKVPAEFVYENRNYTPKSFATFLGLKPENYLTLTSFLHQPFYTSYILSIPDNFANGLYLNVPLDELTKIIDEALAKGYTVALDIDVSETGFSAGDGMAVCPKEEAASTYFKTILPEKWVSAAEREEAYLTYETTDDHLMHIVGKYKDSLGNIYYKTKNSWGTLGVGNQGFVMISQAYLRYKTVGILLHKSAVSPEILSKSNLNNDITTKKVSRKKY